MSKQLSAVSFQLIGRAEAPVIRMAAGDDPILVVIDNKLVKATRMVQPTLTLDGASGAVSLGELVIVEARLENEGREFVKSAKIKWNVTEAGQTKLFWNDGRKVIFGTGIKPTLINVDARITLAYDVAGETLQKTVSASQAVKVGTGPVPGPTPPTPGPNPGPKPVPDLTGVSKVVYDWAKDPAVVLPDAASLGKGAAALSANFKKVSQSIGGDGFKDANSILLQTKSGNNDALMMIGVDPRKWDEWGKRLQEYLYGKYLSKELATLDQFKKMWYDISVGLWAVK